MRTSVVGGKVWKFEPKFVEAEFDWRRSLLGWRRSFLEAEFGGRV
jgi:hypothetical protein